MKNLYLSLDFLIRKILLSATNGNIKSFVKRVVWFLLVYTRIFLATIIVKVNKKFGLPFRFNKVVYIPDVFLVSYPKAGRTWVRVMLAKTLMLMGGSPKKLELIRFTHDNSDNGKEIARYSAFTNKWNDKRIILLIRDPRDIVVSYFFQVTKRDTEINNFSGNLSTFIRSKEYGIQRIIDYYNRWYDLRSLAQDFVLIKYEDLSVNPKSEFGKICKFIFKREIDNKVLDESIKFAEFKNMRKMEKSGESILSDPRALLPKNKNDLSSYKTRKGIVGGYVNYLTKKDLAYANTCIKELNPIFNYN